MCGLSVLTSCPPVLTSCPGRVTVPVTDMPRHAAVVSQAGTGRRFAPTACVSIRTKEDGQVWQQRQDRKLPRNLDPGACQAQQPTPRGQSKGLRGGSAVQEPLTNYGIHNAAFSVADWPWCRSWEVEGVESRIISAFVAFRQDSRYLYLLVLWSPRRCRMCPGLHDYILGTACSPAGV